MRRDLVSRPACTSSRSSFLLLHFVGRPSVLPTDNRNLLPLSFHWQLCFCIIHSHWVFLQRQAFFRRDLACYVLHAFLQSNKVFSFTIVKVVILFDQLITATPFLFAFTGNSAFAFSILFGFLSKDKHSLGEIW